MSDRLEIRRRLRLVEVLLEPSMPAPILEAITAAAIRHASQAYHGRASGALQPEAVEALHRLLLSDFAIRHPAGADA